MAERRWTYTRQSMCSCGSAWQPIAIYDARGIFLTFACEQCRVEKLSKFRPEVLTDPNYWTDEPVDEP